MTLYFFISCLENAKQIKKRNIHDTIQNVKFIKENKIEKKETYIIQSGNNLNIWT